VIVVVCQKTFEFLCECWVRTKENGNYCHLLCVSSVNKVIISGRSNVGLVIITRCSVNEVNMFLGALTNGYDLCIVELVSQ